MSDLSEDQDDSSSESFSELDSDDESVTSSEEETTLSLKRRLCSLLKIFRRRKVR